MHLRFLTGIRRGILLKYKELFKASRYYWQTNWAIIGCVVQVRKTLSITFAQIWQVLMNECVFLWLRTAKGHWQWYSMNELIKMQLSVWALRWRKVSFSLDFYFLFSMREIKHSDCAMTIVKRCKKSKKRKIHKCCIEVYNTAVDVTLFSRTRGN